VTLSSAHAVQLINAIINQSTVDALLSSAPRNVLEMPQHPAPANWQPDIPKQNPDGVLDPHKPYAEYCQNIQVPVAPGSKH